MAAETWTLSAMSLGLAVALLGLGVLADNFGRRRVLRLSAAALALTAALAAAAPSIGVLVVARVLQGAAGAGVLAAGLGAIGHAFPAGASRTRATAVWGGALGAGIAIGPIVGAALAAGPGWRSSYWLQAAAAAALVPAGTGLIESHAGTRRDLDIAGLVTLAGAMAALTAALVQGRSDWGSPVTVALLVGAALLLAGFGAIERARRHPLLELRFLTQPTFVASITGAGVTGLALIGLMSYSPTLLHLGLHEGILASAAVLAIWSTTSTLFALAARGLPERLPSHLRLSLGLALAATGELGLTGLSSHSSWTALAPGLVVAGVGSGIANAALGRLAVESVPPERTGMGSGANNTARYLGGAAGVALVVAVVSAAGGGSTGAAALASGWDRAALVSAALCALGALIAAACGRRRPSDGLHRHPRTVSTRVRP